MPRRYAKRTDANEKDIVRTLLKIPGVSVATDHHDILVGYKNLTYWFEIKTPVCVKRNGELRAGAKRDSQKELDVAWKGHREYATNADQIIRSIGLITDG